MDESKSQALGSGWMNGGCSYFCSYNYPNTSYNNQCSSFEFSWASAGECGGYTLAPGKQRVVIIYAENSTENEPYSPELDGATGKAKLNRTALGRLLNLKAKIDCQNGEGLR